MGSVSEAEDVVLKRRVAVKILSPALCDNETVAARFRREAQAAGRLTHPNIAQVFDYGEDDACPYIVLELLSGSTLRALLEERGPLPHEEVAEIGAQIADALAAAHAEGIVHRDVKPGNVMVLPDGRVKVMDFGIADAVWFEPLTDTGTIMATALYISPEQATGGGATSASDVYSLGAVLYELFAGRLPFEANSPFAIAHAHAYEVPESLADAAPGVPEPMRLAVQAAMRKDPRERPTAAELAAALRAGAATGDATAVLSLVGSEPTERVADRGASDAEPSRVDADPAYADPPDTRAGTSRAAAWVLGGLAALAVVLALAFVLLAATSSSDRPGRAENHRTARSSATPGSRPAADAPASKQPKPPKDHGEGPGGPAGRALGHEEEDGPGHDG